MNGKGQIDYFIAIVSIIIIGIIIIGGFQLWLSFYDFETISGGEGTIGELDIDTETIEDIEESLDELNETVWEGFDFDALGSVVVIPLIIIAGIILLLWVFLQS